MYNGTVSPRYSLSSDVSLLDSVSGRRKGTGTVMAASSEQTLTRTEQALSACSGALLTSAFVTPLDVVKVRMQSPTGAFSAECPCCSSLHRASSAAVALRVARHEVGPCAIEPSSSRDNFRTMSHPRASALLPPRPVRPSPSAEASWHALSVVRRRAFCRCGRACSPRLS